MAIQHSIFHLILFQNVHWCHSEQIFKSISWEITFMWQLSSHNLDHLGFHPRKIPIHSYLLRPRKIFPPSVEGYVTYRSLFFKSTALSTCRYITCLTAICCRSAEPASLAASLLWWPFASWARDLSFQRHYWLSNKWRKKTASSELCGWGNSSVWNEGHMWVKSA